MEPAGDLERHTGMYGYSGVSTNGPYAGVGVRLGGAPRVNRTFAFYLVWWILIPVIPGFLVLKWSGIWSFRAARGLWRFCRKG